MEKSDNNINLLIADVSRTSISEQRIINRLFLSSNKILKDLFGSEISIIGAAYNNVLLPNECVEATQFLTSKDLKQWSVEACHAINLESTKSSLESDDGDDQSMDTILLSVNGNYVQCQRGKVGVQLSVNNIDGLLLTSSLEQFNNAIGNDNLFKRSLILIKMWIYNESRRFSYLDLSELFQHNALVVMTMMIFAVSMAEIDHPLTALSVFLDTFAKMNWATSQVTATGIIPKKSVTNYFSSISTPSIYGEDMAKATLESILEKHRSYFANISDADEALGHAKSDNDSDNSRDGNTNSDGGGSNSPLHSITSGCILNSTSSTDDVIVVTGPFSSERNFCGSCPSYFRRKNIAEELRTIFGRGSFELSTLLAQLGQWKEGPGKHYVNSDPFNFRGSEEMMLTNAEFVDKVFPYTNALQSYRYEDAQIAEYYIVDSTAAVFQAICSNFPSTYATAIAEGSGAYSEAITYSRVLQNMDNLIAHTVQIASKMVTEESIINLVVQALHRFGPMPIGEIGKQLQVMTRNPDFPKLLKKRFGGLKKFIFSHPEFFSREDNHNFNPVVFVVGQEAPHPAAPKPSVAPAVPVPSQKIDPRKGAVDYAPVPAQQPQPQQLQKQQLQKIPSDPIPLMTMFDDRQSLLLQPRAKSMAISPPKHQPLQQMSQQLHHPPAANHFNHHPQQQPQPHHHYQQPQQQQYHQQLHRHHDPPQQQQEYFFPKQEHYGLDRLQHSRSSFAPTFNRGVAAMTECLEQRIGKVILITPIFETSAKSSCVVADEAADEDVDKILNIPHELYDRLFSHQKYGVRWLYGLYSDHSGGILGDDMGLGKTFQVTVFLACMLRTKSISRVLIVAPVSVLESWKRELHEHLLPHIPKGNGLQIDVASAEMSKKKRISTLRSVFDSKHEQRIIISSYHLVANMTTEFATLGEWDYVILDEGHIIKNPRTKISKAMHQTRSPHRLILTGTPIQNNLAEFYSLIDWVTQGRLLGSLSNFKARFSNPITTGQDPRASDAQRKVAAEAAGALMAVTKKILLQRKKCEQPSEALKLPDKTEVVVWVPLSTEQRTIYQEFIESKTFKYAMIRSTYPVEIINHLKTLCRHPFLLEASSVNMRRKEQVQKKSLFACESDDADQIENLIGDLDSMNISAKAPSSGMDKENTIEDCELEHIRPNASVFDIAGRDPDNFELMKGSVKLRVLVKLLCRFHQRGHRTLVFSQSRLMLDIIQRTLAENSLATHRIDGSVTAKDRQKIIDEFNDLSEDNMGPTICLLTTKACGCGITLTGADRVVIFDPSWNPAEDRQAVDRAYRIGQRKDVVVYRMIMAASVEEKMYEKQVFKDGLRVVTESGSSSRYFSSKETTDLFKLGPPGKSAVMEKLWELVGSEFKTFDDTHGDLPSVLGFSRHDTLYRETRPKELQAQSLVSSAVSVQVSFSASKAPAAAAVHKEDIRNHFCPSQVNELDNSGDRRNPPSSGTKKAVEIISLLSSDESSSDDGEDDDDQLAENLQNLKLQSTPIREETSAVPLLEPEPDTSTKKELYVERSTTPLLFEDEVENEHEPGEPQERSASSSPERDASITVEEEGSIEVEVQEDPHEKRSTTPILFEDSEEENNEAGGQEYSDDVEIPPDRIATPILFETAEEEEEYELSDQGAASAVEDTPDRNDSLVHTLNTTPILYEDGEEEYEPSEQQLSGSSTPEQHNSSSNGSVEGTPEEQHMKTTTILHDDSTSVSSSPEQVANAIQYAVASANPTPLLFDYEADVGLEPYVQEYSASSLTDKDVDAHDPPHKETEYEPREQECSESMAQLDCSEFENSCWIPELVEIQSLLQNCHDYPDKKAAVPPHQEGYSHHKDKNENVTVENSSAPNTISPLTELSPVNRRRSSVDRFLNNCAQPDLFFSPPVPRNPGEFESEVKSSWDSRTSLQSNTGYPTFTSLQEPLHGASSRHSLKPSFLNTPSEAISRVIVHTTSKPAMPFLCVSSDSETSTVSKHSISRDSVLSVDHMADRFGTDDGVTSPEMEVIPEPNSSGGKWQRAADSLNNDDTIEELNTIHMCIQKESNSFHTDEALEESADRNTSSVALNHIDDIIDSMESIALSDPLGELDLPSNSSHMNLKSDCAASLEEQVASEESMDSCPFSNQISTFGTWTSVAIPTDKVESLPPLDEYDVYMKEFVPDTSDDHLDTKLAIDSYYENTTRKSFGTVNKSETAVDTRTPARALDEQDIPDALLSYTHLQDVVVEPFPTLGDAKSAATIVASSNSSLLSSLRSHGVVLEDILVPLKPVECLTTEDIRLYNDCIIEANAHDDMLQAAVLFMQALSICDSDFKLHCKLAWICDTLKKQK